MEAKAFAKPKPPRGVVKNISVLASGESEGNTELGGNVTWKYTLSEAANHNPNFLGGEILRRNEGGGIEYITFPKLTQPAKRRLHILPGVLDRAYKEGKTKPAQAFLNIFMNFVWLSEVKDVGGRYKMKVESGKPNFNTMKTYLRELTEATWVGLSAIYRGKRDKFLNAGPHTSQVDVTLRDVSLF